MRSYGEPLEVGERDDIVLTWTYGEHHRAIIGMPWPGPRVVLERVLRLFPGGRGFEAAIAQQLGRLADPGDAITVQMGDGHLLALVRPYISRDIDVRAPVLLALGPCLDGPVLFGDIESALAFTRREQDRRGGGGLPWTLHLGEAHDGIAEVFNPRLTARGVLVARTRLEADLGTVLRAGASRAA